MRRREFITLLGGAVAAPALLRPLAASAQAQPEIGILNSLSFLPILDRLEAFFEKLEENGLVVDRDISVEFRSAEGRAELLPELAADLVGRNVKAIVCLTSANTVRAARLATSTIPIVFAVSGDPAELGLTENFNGLHGNVTGAGRRTEELNPERLGVICELVPKTSTVGFLLNSDHLSADTANERIRNMEAAARANGRRLVILDLATGPDVGTIFAGLKENGTGALVLSTEAMFTVWRDQVIALAARHGIATIFPNREYVLSGGLISFGADLYEHYRVAGAYTGRILKGEKPSDLPVQTPTKYELAINLKTARALGLAVPAAMLMRADKVIE